MSSKTKIILTIFLISLVLCIYVIYDKQNNSENTTNNNINDNETLANQTITPSTNDLIIRQLVSQKFESISKYENNYTYGTVDGKYVVYDINGQKIDTLENKEYTELKDGYYSYCDDTVLTLKRNGNIVSTINSSINCFQIKDVINEFKLYKDDYDEKAFYNSFYDYEESGKENIVYTYYINKENITKTVFYNKITGELIKEIDGKIAKYNVNNELKYYKNTTIKGVRLINIDTYEPIFKEYYSDIEPSIYPKASINYSNIYIENNKYIVAVKKNKYGLIDYKGKIILPFEYDNLTLGKNSDKYIVAIKNNKYGLVEITSKKNIAEFTYDLIVMTDNFIITVKNKKLSIFNKSLKVISYEQYAVDINKSYYYIPHNTSVMLAIYEDNGNIIISIYKNTKDDSKETKIDVVLLITKDNKLTQLKSYPDENSIITKKNIEMLENRKLTTKYITISQKDTTNNISIYDYNFKLTNKIDHVFTDKKYVSLEVKIILNSDYMMIREYYIDSDNKHINNYIIYDLNEQKAKYKEKEAEEYYIEHNYKYLNDNLLYTTNEKTGQIKLYDINNFELKGTIEGISINALTDKQYAIEIDNKNSNYIIYEIDYKES